MNIDRAFYRHAIGISEREISQNFRRPHHESHGIGGEYETAVYRAAALRMRFPCRYRDIGQSNRWRSRRRDAGYVNLEINRVGSARISVYRAGAVCADLFDFVVGAYVAVYRDTICDIRIVIHRNIA